MSAALNLSTFASHTSKKPRNVQETWPELVAKLRNMKRSTCTIETCGIGENLLLDNDSKPKGCRHKYVGLWSPARYKPDTTRKQENVIDVSVLGIDVDDATSEIVEQMHGRLWGVEHVAHSTHGDRADVRNVRIVARLSRPVLLGEWKTFWRAAMQRFEIPADTQCSDASRMYFLPTLPKDVGEFYFAMRDGDPIDVDDILASAPEPVPVPKPRRKTPRPDESQVIKRARAYLATMDPSISGSAGHLALFKAIAAVMIGFDLDEHTTRTLIVDEFNPKCVPPWGDKAIDYKLKSVLTDCELPRGWLLEAERPQKTSTRTTEVSSEPVSPDEFTCDEHGRPFGSQRNIALAISKLGVRVSFDRFAERELIAGLPDFGPDLSDAALNRLWLTIDSEFGFRPGREFFDSVVSDQARRHSFHPVRDYLDSLKWDGQRRIYSWLTFYGGAPNTDYVASVGQLALVAAVRRIRQPGCKFDEMLVLEDKQGTNKSTALKILAVRDEWFSDDLPLSADTKRFIEATAGHWIIEAGELKGMSGGDVAALKSTLSRTHDRARMSYGRKPTVLARQCVIIGTTNDTGGYLRDSTGNRRFWPVRVTGFDLQKLERDRDQLWAEASEVEKRGGPIRLDRSLWQAAAEEQDVRRVDDPLVAQLGEQLDGFTGKLKIVDCYRLLGIEPGSARQEQINRIGAAMRELGWTRKQKRFGGDPEWSYVKGSAEDQARVIEVSDEFNLKGFKTGVRVTYA